MQQTQQILLSVKHKLPEPNSILPTQLLKSQPAQHIRKRVNNIPAISSYDWPLDRGSQSNKQKIEAILNHYYGPNYDISELLKMESKIVFLNSMVSPSDQHEDNYYFGSIQANLKNVRKSMPNPLVKQSTYELQFDDKIQSGNLYFALQHEPRTYLLANRLDYNTRSYGQWFYFKVTNVTKMSGQFKFCIVNMTKNGTLFGKGLKVSVCRRGNWGKEGTNIQYIPNKFIRKNYQGGKNVSETQYNYYTLVFNLRIDSHETIYVAYNEPYTYTKLGARLDLLTSQNSNISRSIICRTPLGNRIEMITITNKNSLKNKRIIFITARAHPIQTAGSFVMDGIIEELAKSQSSVTQLLENYIIKLVPMVNPDGVIIGNSRCNINGFDLNRQWKNPNKNQAPQILNLKRKILSYQGRIEMFIDLHAHSKKKSVFAYGCHDFKNPIASREFPYLLSKISEKNFTYNQCRFSLLTQSKNDGKDGTARVTLWHRLRIPNIFTIENSYCCAEGSEYHYDSKSYAEIGRDIVSCLCEYLNDPQSRFKTQTNENTSRQFPCLKSNILQELRSNECLVNENIKDESQASSDSQVQDRIFAKKEKKPQENRQKKPYRSKSNKVYLHPRPQTRLAKQAQFQKKRENQITLIRNATIEARNNNISKQQQLVHSTSNLQLRVRRKIYRNLSPLVKKQLPLAKCQGVQQIIYEKPQQYAKINPQLIQKQKCYPIRQNNAISIIDIGLESKLQTKLDSSLENSDMVKAYSAKNIKRQYGLNTRVGVIKTSNSQSIKFTNFLKPFLPTDVNQFSDQQQQQKQPLLKSKKNLPRNSNRLQDLILKLNAMQVKIKNKRTTSPVINRNSDNSKQ